MLRNRLPMRAAMPSTPGALAMLLAAIERHDTNYEVRYGLVLKAMVMAHDLGMTTGYRIDPAEPDWPVAYIALSTGQVSWPMPPFPHEYDGHSVADKYRRTQAYIDGAI